MTDEDLTASELRVLVAVDRDRAFVRELIGELRAHCAKRFAAVG
ncbi:hypothetical protein [Streptosporangium roseum]